MSPELAVNIVWLVWYIPWIAAVVWSAKTKTQMGTDIQGAHRLLSGLGVMFLFFVPAISGGALFGSTLLGVFATKLWHGPAWAAWSLVALTVAAFGFCRCKYGDSLYMTSDQLLIPDCSRFAVPRSAWTGSSN